MDIKKIRTLIDLMQKTGLAVFKLEDGDFKITLKTPEGALESVTTLNSASPAGISAPFLSAPALPTIAPSSIVTSESSAKSESSSTVDANTQEVLSPMVGTFYSSPSPDAPSFVQVGQEVGPDTVVCIIEAMKVMNEIKAEVSGKVVEIVAENGKPVQFGQPLLRIA